MASAPRPSEPAMLPRAAEVVERRTESRTIFTLRLRLVDSDAAFEFAPGQFNMLYLHGVGEVPISIVSDPEDRSVIDHTIRAVGRVTHGLADLKPGDRLGLRGPFGRGWPLAAARGQDIIIVTGGLGCAPTVSVIHYVVRRRAHYGRLTVIQGVKHAEDLIWREQYAQWSALPDTEVLIAADEGASLWPFHVGRVTELFGRIQADPANAVAMMCGPEGMMRAAAAGLEALGLPTTAIWLSMERSMQCAVGHCGHCQFGGRFVCKDGPVFRYHDVQALLAEPGF
ncbi:MAG TPA: FAD/NAD(P)-binding protein [Acidiferrobacterales bacterium]